jgi:glycosyltransferase involved in cell wall biosynthesis
VEDLDLTSRVAVVVPTRNSGRTLPGCLTSLLKQTVPTIVIVVDNYSTDATQCIAQNSASLLIVAGPERSRQRNVGAGAVDALVVGFIDSDMTVPPKLVEEALAAVEGGAGAVIVPEITVGTGYWARVRAFERSFYAGRAVEAARFFRHDVFEACAGFNENLDAGEDWDLTLRARAVAPVTRIRSVILHHEGRVRYLAHCRKKGTYAAGLRGFVALHGRAGLRAALDRPYLRYPWRLVWPHPVLGSGVVALKLGEAVAITAVLARTALRGRHESQRHDPRRARMWIRERSTVQNEPGESEG